MIIKPSKAEQVQYLVPVIGGSILEGIIQIPPTKFSGESQQLMVGSRKVVAQCLEFSDLSKGLSRNLFCLVFPPAMSHHLNFWNGLAGFIAPSEFGNLSIWATPVGNIDYQRVDAGLLNLFDTNKFDRPPTSKVEKPVQQFGIRVKVGADRLVKKLSFIEFDLCQSITNYCSKLGIKTINYLETVFCPPEFKCFAYTDSSSSGIPTKIRLMRITQSDQKVYNLIFNLGVEGEVIKLVVEVCLI